MGPRRYPKFFHGMLNAGVTPAPGAYEAMFPSLAHIEADIAQTLEADAVAATP